MPAPDTIADGLADGTYKHAHDPILNGGVDDYGEFVNLAYYVPFAYRNTFIREALGVSDEDGGGGTWNQAGPRQCEIDGAENLYAFGARWESVGELETNSVGDPISYSDVKIIMQYRTPFYNWSGGSSYPDPYYLHSITGDPAENALMLFATQEVQTNTETIRVPDRELVWGSGTFTGDPIDTPFLRHTTYLDLHVTFQRVPYLPRGLSSLANTLNDTTFLGYEAGKAWFRGYRTQLKSWVGGIRTRSVQLHFSLRKEADWNYKLNKRLEWALVENSSDSSTLYEYANLTDVLRLQFLAS